MSKYKNVRTVVDDIKFSSQKEASRYRELKLLEKAGEISFLELQKRFKLIINDELICTYIGDFSYVANESYVVEDVKSEFTKKLPIYRIKKKLMKALWKIDIVEV